MRAGLIASPKMWRRLPEAGEAPPFKTRCNRTRDRAAAIRQIFLREFNGFATVHEIASSAQKAKILSTRLTPERAAKVIRAALQGIALPMLAP